MSGALEGCAIEGGYEDVLLRSRWYVERVLYYLWVDMMMY